MCGTVCFLVQGSALTSLLASQVTLQISCRVMSAAGEVHAQNPSSDEKTVNISGRILTLIDS